MSFFRKSSDQEISKLQNLSINSPKSDDKDRDYELLLKEWVTPDPEKSEKRMMLSHPFYDDSENENKIEQIPDSPVILDKRKLHPRVMRVLNSVRKKSATPDYTRISHHRTSQQTSCRFLRFPNRDPPRGPFFISFKEKPVIIETNNYDIRFKMTSFFDQTFKHARCIGKGSFGEVFKALCKDDNRWYAVKISMEPFRSTTDREDKLREVQKHELLPKHPNLISYVRAWEEYGFLYIQTELCQCSLMDYKMKVGVIAEKDLWLFFGDIALAVRYLHSHDLLHMDIKPQNIMVSFDGICKLGDFSLIVDIQKNLEGKLMEEGDGKYLAPEVLQSGAQKASDIFSLGMTMIDICTDCELPTTGDLWQGFRCKRINDEFIKDIPPALLDVILPLLETDPFERPTAEEICDIPMIAKCIHERQYEYLERNIWWILLTVGYSSLFASSWIVQPARTAIMHAATYLKRMRSVLPRCAVFHHLFRATSDESPMFKSPIIPRVTDPSRLELKFEDDDEDYNYDDTDTDSGGKTNMSQSEDELVNVMETSVNEELHYDLIETVSGMGVEKSSPNTHEFGQDGIDDRLTHLFHDNFYKFDAGDDIFGRKKRNILPGEKFPYEISMETISSLETPENFELQLNISTCDTLGYEDHELPSTSGSISDRPKSPEPPPSDEASPSRDGYITPPSYTTPSPFVCKKPARGRFDDSAEQRLRHYYWWHESFRSPSGRIHQEAAEAAASNDTLPEVPDENQLSRLETRLALSFGDATRRRSYFHMREPSPPAKRAQIDNEDDTDEIDDPRITKSDTDAK